MPDTTPTLPTAGRHHPRWVSAILLLIIVALSTILRLQYSNLNWIPSGDEGQYLDVAKSLFEGHGFIKHVQDPNSPTGLSAANDIMPLYVSAVALVHKAVGYSPRNAYYVNLAFSAILTILVFFLAYALISSLPAALFAAVAAGLDPVLTGMSSLATKDISFCVCVLLLANVLARPRTKRFVLLTILTAALVVLSRRNGYWFLPPLFVFLTFTSPEKPLKRSAIHAGLMMCIVAIVCSPWYILVNTGTENELGTILRLSREMSQQASAHVGNAQTPFITAFIHLFAAQIQRALISLATDSPFTMMVIPFIPFAFKDPKIRSFGIFWGISLAIFLGILCTLQLEDTSLMFYYLPFYSILMIFGIKGVHTIGNLLPLARRERLIWVILLFTIPFASIAENIRNHVHPRLKVKYSETAGYNDIQQVISWLNSNTEPQTLTAGCSYLRQFLHDLRPRLIALPQTGATFNADYFHQHNIKFIIVGVENLRRVERQTARDYLNNYWRDDEGILTETARPSFLKPVFSTRSQSVYEIVSPRE